jgi:hypothetical protein
VEFGVHPARRYLRDRFFQFFHRLVNFFLAPEDVANVQPRQGILLEVFRGLAEKIEPLLVGGEPGGIGGRFPEFRLGIRGEPLLRQQPDQPFLENPSFS